MANRVITLEDEFLEPKKTGLEVYRDISLVADLNQANILRSYKQIIPMAYLATNLLDDEEHWNLSGYLHGEEFAPQFQTIGFNIKAQISNEYYVEQYGEDLTSFTQLLGTEHDSEEQLSSIITEDRLDNILLLKDAGQVSSFAQWKEAKMWNPYKLAKLVNVKAIYNSLNNIFTWTPGERILNPEFGSNLKKLLYEGITDFTIEAIIAEIRRCIQEYEPRVNIVTIRNASNINDTENNTIQIDIVFTVPSLSREQFIYSYKYNQYDNQ